MYAGMGMEGLGEAVTRSRKDLGFFEGRRKGDWRLELFHRRLEIRNFFLFFWTGQISLLWVIGLGNFGFFFTIAYPSKF